MYSDNVEGKIQSTVVSDDDYEVATPSEPDWDKSSSTLYGECREEERNNNKEIHVGNIPPGTPLEVIHQFLNEWMTATFLCSSDATPVTKCRMNGTSAIVEFDSTTNTMRALDLSEVIFSGHILHIHPPQDYTGPDTPSLNWHQLMASITSLDVSEFKLFYICKITDDNNFGWISPKYWR